MTTMALWQFMHLGTCMVYHVPKCMNCRKAMAMIARGHIVFMIAYIYIYTYIYIYIYDIYIYIQDIYTCI